MPNKLINEKSPYLLQHAHNPVDWYSWGEEAFTQAQKEEKPIFLSIGYSSCHWCHVMEKESFADEAVAQILNKYYVSIKVDREERPDLDQLYLSFCQALTGQGGWPLTVFLTPEQKPFFAGTYFPKKRKAGLPGLLDLLERIAQLWEKEKEKIVGFSENLTASVFGEDLNKGGELSGQIVEEAYQQLVSIYDPFYGGFGVAPKFPTPHRLTFLLHYYSLRGKTKALAMVEKSLIQMFKGGLFDQLGFGFSRYATERQWLIPHFEKMLSDQALLALAYLEAYQLTGGELYRQVVEKIFTYVLREMTDPEGGFYTAEDADSEGVEGQFYLWSPLQIKEVLGEKRGEEFCQAYNLTSKGNFNGLNILNLLQCERDTLFKIEEEFKDEREKLYRARQKRVAPFKDDKILTAWNGLMIAALAKGSRILAQQTYLTMAEKAYNFLEENLQRADGRLFARYRQGDADILAYLDDYAFVVWALLELYESTYRPFYLEKAMVFNQKMLSLFGETKQNYLYLTGKDSEKLIVRPRETLDGALPAGNSVAILNLLKLSALTGEVQLMERAQQLFAAVAQVVEKNPLGHTYLLQAYLYAQNYSTVVIVEGENKHLGKEMLSFLRQNFLPFTTSSYLFSEGTLSTDYQAINGQTTAYFCQGRKCRAPIQKLNEFKREIGI